jgi:hypothetical protein
LVFLSRLNLRAQPTCIRPLQNAFAILPISTNAEVIFASVLPGNKTGVGDHFDVILTDMKSIRFIQRRVKLR